jgi:hypothetical protein
VVLGLTGFPTGDFHKPVGWMPPSLTAQQCATFQMVQFKRTERRHPSREPLRSVFCNAANALPYGDLAHVNLSGTCAGFAMIGQHLTDRRKWRGLGPDARKRRAIRGCYPSGLAIYLRLIAA